MNFKMNESYSDMKALRSQFISSDKENNRIHFHWDLTEEQVNSTNEIVSEILSNDPDIVKKALEDFISQLKLLSNKVVGFLHIRHIQRIIELLNHNDFYALSLNILSQIREGFYSQMLIDFNFLSYGVKFLNQNNSIYALYSIIIITNNSIISDEFRNAAFEQKVFHKIKECKIIDLETIAWSLKSALEKEPYILNIQEEIPRMLIEISEDPENCLARSYAIEAFNLLESRGYYEYRHIILENRYIYVLTDVCNTDEEYKKEALEVISYCCNCGNECLVQIFNYDTINIFSEIINTNKDDDYMICFTNFLTNSLFNSDDMYVSNLVKRFCNQNLGNLFINHSSIIYPKAAATIQRLFNATTNPELIANALTPNLIINLSDLLFINNYVYSEDGSVTLNVLYIFENILTKLIVLSSTHPILQNVVMILTELVQKEEYFKLMYDDTENDNDDVHKNAIILKKMVEDLLPKEV